MSRILHHVGRNDFKKTRQRQIVEQKKLAVQKLKEWEEVEAERKQIEEAAKPFKSDWRIELSEKMSTSGMTSAVFDAEGDVDLSTNDVGASASYFKSSNAQFSGSQATFNFSGSASVGQTYARTGFFNQIDATKFDSFVTRVTVGSGPSSWNEPRVGTPTHNFPGGFRVVMYSKSKEGDPYSYSSTELSTGTNTITIPSNKRVSDLVKYYTGWANKVYALQTGGVTGLHIVHSIQLQRRTPMNVFVSLDDPDAIPFIRGNLGGDKERRKRFKDQLEAGNEWMHA